MNTYRRSKQSKLLEEISIYTSDLERITLLRNKVFKLWTLDGNQGTEQDYKAEWENYNHVIDIMQQVLIFLSEQALPKDKRGNKND